MAIVEQAPSGGTVAGDSRQSWIRTNWGLLLAVAVLAGILLLPTPACEFSLLALERRKVH